MKTVKAATYNKSFSIGRRGENIARQIVFDLSDFVAEYGEGTPELIFQRPIDDKPYPVATVRNGSKLLWTVTDLDTAVATTNGGYSRCELRWYIGDLLAKSQTWLVYVDTAMNVPSETVPPDPESGWVEQVLAAGAESKASAESAKADADRAEAALDKGPKIENRTWWVYDSQSQSYVDTGVKAEAKDGYTPQKGVDYFTDADKQELVQDVLNMLPNAEEGNF